MTDAANRAASHQEDFRFGVGCEGRCGEVDPRFRFCSPDPELKLGAEAVAGGDGHAVLSGGGRSSTV